MKRALLFAGRRDAVLVTAATGLVAATYGLVRLAYGLFLPDIRASLAMSPTTASLTSSGASLAYCAGALLGLGAARHARLLVAGALLTAAVGSAGMALAVDVRVFVPFAVLGSTGAGLASPGLVAVVERNLRAAAVPRAQAVVNAGTGPGLVAAGVLALVLLPDWRLGFTVAAVASAGAGFVVLAADRPGRLDRPGPTHPGSGVPWRQLPRPALAALLLGAGSAAVWTYGRTQLIDGGLGDTTSTVAWVVLGLGGTLAVLTAGPMAGHPPALAWRVTGTAVALSTLGIALAPGHLPVALAACGVFGWGFVAATSALVAWASLALPGRAAAGTSLLFVTLVLGQAIGAALVPLPGHGDDLTPGFALMAAVAVLAAVGGLPGSVGAGAARVPD